MLTKSWVAVHRKHHARCETPDDPHSPQILGLKKVLLEGAELYGVQARNPETLEKFGRGTPDDWIERNLYTEHQYLGVTLYVIACLVLFGVPGIIILSVQLIATPLMAAGIVNGVGHYCGLSQLRMPGCGPQHRAVGPADRRRRTAQQSPCLPELGEVLACSRGSSTSAGCTSASSPHSASRKVIRIAPQPLRQQHRPVDLDTVQAVVINRMHVLRDYSAECDAARAAREIGSVRRPAAHGARKLFVREPALLNDASRRRLSELLASNPSLKTVHDFRAACSCCGAVLTRATTTCCST